MVNTISPLIMTKCVKQVGPKPFIAHCGGSHVCSPRPCFVAEEYHRLLLFPSFLWDTASNVLVTPTFWNSVFSFYEETWIFWGVFWQLKKLFFSLFEVFSVNTWQIISKSKGFYFTGFFDWKKNNKEVKYNSKTGNSDGCENLMTAGRNELQ